MHIGEGPVTRGALEERNQHGRVDRIVESTRVVGQVLVQRDGRIPADIDRLPVHQVLEHLAGECGHIGPVAVDGAARHPGRLSEPVDRQAADAVRNENGADGIVHRRPGTLVARIGHAQVMSVSWDRNRRCTATPIASWSTVRRGPRSNTERAERFTQAPRKWL